MALVAAALLWLTGAGPDASSFPSLCFPFALMGLGMGTAMLPLLTIAMRGVPERDAGLGSGILNVTMQLSGALGIAVLGTLAAVAVGIAVSLAVLRVPAREQPRPAGSELAVEL
jgi:hypothetical protein